MRGVVIAFASLFAGMHATLAQVPAGAWLADGHLSRAGQVMVGAISGAAADGLDPRRYDGPALDSVMRALASPGAPADVAAELDRHLSESALAFVRDLRLGREPGRRVPDAEWPDAWDADVALVDAIRGDSVARMIDAARPPFSQYRALMRVLAQYRTLAAGPADSTRDSVPIGTRVRQIELAMERLRRLPRIQGQRFIVVNVPAYTVLAFDSAGDSGVPALQARVIVGGAVGRQTPTMFERVRFVEFRPYWNVPPSILREEILPQLARSPGYLRARDMEIVGAGERVLGDVATPALVADLARGAARVRQRPGGRNALGLVKLVFPNPSNVYLHGTPTPELFALTRRDLSHGCIRVEDPASLAEWVLREEPGWDADAVERAMKGPATRRVTVTHPVPIFIFYTTAIVRADGTVQFYDDVYDLDRPGRQS
jgi:murein L,D-transpeptidase YcbB/YkuD